MSFPFAIELTSVADEMIYCHIPDDTFIGTCFQYEISNSEKRVCRKGHFHGTRVQIRVAELKEGNYFFNIQTDANNKYSFQFEKVSAQKDWRDQ